MSRTGNWKIVRWKGTERKDGKPIYGVNEGWKMKQNERHKWNR